MQRSDFLLVVSDERYLSVAKVPSSHSASRARRDCAGTSRIVVSSKQSELSPRFEDEADLISVRSQVPQSPDNGSAAGRPETACCGWAKLRSSALRSIA